MLSPRDTAQSKYREVVSMGTASVLGADVDGMAVITAGRLDRARRAELTIRAALGSQRTGLLKPDDAALEVMLRQVQTVVRRLDPAA